MKPLHEITEDDMIGFLEKKSSLLNGQPILVDVSKINAQEKNKAFLNGKELFTQILAHVTVDEAAKNINNFISAQSKLTAAQPAIKAQEPVAKPASRRLFGLFEHVTKGEKTAPPEPLNNKPRTPGSH